MARPTAPATQPSTTHPATERAARPGREQGRDTTRIDAWLTEVRAEWNRWRLREGQLLIVDEAGLAGTFQLAALARQAADAGAKLLLVGDPCQLSPVETGGAFTLLCTSRPDPPTLTVVRRFTNPDGTRRAWEEAAAAQLRIGDTTATRQYQDHGRIHAGTGDEITDAAYAAWRADTLTGRSSVLIAATTDTVRTLNERARTDLVAAGIVDDKHNLVLHDGLLVGRGDHILTRRIDRDLPDGTSTTTSASRTRWDGFVRNGQRWRVDRVRRDGSLIVKLLDHSGGTGAAAVTLPASMCGSTWSWHTRSPRTAPKESPWTPRTSLPTRQRREKRSTSA